MRSDERSDIKHRSLLVWWNGMFGSLRSLLRQIIQRVWHSTHYCLRKNRWIFCQLSHLCLWQRGMYCIHWVDLLFDIWRWVLSEDGLRYIRLY